MEGKAIRPERRRTPTLVRSANGVNLWVPFVMRAMGQWSTRVCSGSTDAYDKQVLQAPQG
jgi:hypothetical protein